MIFPLLSTPQSLLSKGRRKGLEEDQRHDFMRKGDRTEEIKEDSAAVGPDKL